MTGSTQEEQEEEEKIIAVEDKTDDEGDDEEGKEAKEKEGQEEQEQEDDEEEGERLGASEDDDDDAATKLEKRRSERKTRKERQKVARARDQKEMSFLRGRNETLERRFSELDARVGHSEVAQVDTRITDLKSQIKLADQVITKSIDSQDGASYTEAQGIRDNLRDQLNRMEYAKQSMTQRAEQPERDPRLISHAADWVKSHDWWDPNGGDADSRKVSQLDAQLVNEQYDPTTPEYWDMLSERVKEALPHRYSDDEGNGEKKPKPKAKPKGPTMSVGGRERPLKKNEVYISPERKEAMIEAGVWEDPELRQKYLKSYSKYDAENRA
jgi:hypothetical protein